MKVPPGVIGLNCFLSVSCFVLPAPSVCAQPPPALATAPELEVVAINGAGKEKRLPSINGLVPMLMVRPNQVVPVTLQFPAAKAGTLVAVTPLDGGGIVRLQCDRTAHRDRL